MSFCGKEPPASDDVSVMSIAAVYLAVAEECHMMLSSLLDPAQVTALSETATKNSILDSWDVPTIDCPSGSSQFCHCGGVFFILVSIHRGRLSAYVSTICRKNVASSSSRKLFNISSHK
jgi:hypothetical protein